MVQDVFTQKADRTKVSIGGNEDIAVNVEEWANNFDELFGERNRDGSLNTDETGRVQYSFSKLEAATPEQLALYDLDGDGKLSAGTRSGDNNYSDVVKIAAIGDNNFHADQLINEVYSNLENINMPTQYKVGTSGRGRLALDFERGSLDPYRIQEGLQVNSRLLNRGRYSGASAQDVSNLLHGYYLDNLNEDQFRAYEQGTFDPVRDPTSSIYDPQKVANTFGKDILKANDPTGFAELYPDEITQPTDNLEDTQPEQVVDDTPEPVAEPVVTPTPTYSIPSTPSFTTQPMSSGTYQSPTVTQPQFTSPVDPNTGTFQLQQGMGFAPSNVQFNVPQISTGVLGQGQSMGYNPTLQLVAPQPYVQSGYMPTFRYNEGGMVPNTMQQQQPASAMPMTQSTFGGFKPEAMQRIAGSLGYQGDMAGFDGYLNANPDKKQKMDMYNQKAMQMARGGIVQKFQEGGSPTLSYGAYGYNEGDAGYVPSDPRPLGQQYIPEQEFYPSTVEVPIYDDAGNQTGTRTETRGYSLQDAMATQALFPGLPTGATVVPVGVSQEAGQFIDPRSGQVYGSSALPTALATTTQAGMPQATPTTLMTAATGAEAVDKAVSGMQPAQGEVTDQALVTGQEGVSSLNIDAAQGTATMMTNPVTREIQSGELISGAADAQKAAKFTEQIQAATAEPSQKATVQGQLEGLMQQFEGGDTPAWAAGAMRNAMGAMAARGLGASSLAGQAAVQAAMESALPIAQADAQTQAKFESQNLSNRQQRAMLAAQQRAQFIGQEFDQAFQSRVMNASKISDVANMNFTAEQQVALENSRAANSMNLANLSNRQASVMAEAAAIANMDMANLNNRQQAAVMNAQSFLQMDMANLSNKQQTELFQAQQRVQSLFNDQAAMNAAAQFNASSQNQTDQFFANLASQTSQFNASQANAQSQFNAGQTNVIERFNTEINNQREQFNASNRLVIDQANATWRREIATMDTAAVNRANETNAEALLGVSRDAYNNLWQYYSDNMEWAWTSAENEKTRYVNMAMAELNSNTELDLAAFKADYQSSIGFGNMIGKILTTDLTGSLGGTILGDVFDFLGG